MKRIDTTQIVDPIVKQPFTGRSLKFLQDAKAEDIAAIIKAFVISNVGSYSLTTPYVISGCLVTAAGANVSAGEIFYGGQFFETTAIAGATNIPVQFILTKTQDAIADPVEFTDNSFKNVHDIYKYIATDTAIPQIFEATDFVYLKGANIYSNIYDAANFSVVGAPYIDFTSMTYTTPNDGITRKYIIKFKSAATTSNGAADANCFLRIQDTTNAITLDESKVGKANLGVAEVTISPVYMSTGVITIAPNTTIKIQGGIAASTVGFIFNRMTVEEFR